MTTNAINVGRYRDRCLNITSEVLEENVQRIRYESMPRDKRNSKLVDVVELDDVIMKHLFSF